MELHRHLRDTSSYLCSSYTKQTRPQNYLAQSNEGPKILARPWTDAVKKVIPTCNYLINIKYQEVTKLVIYQVIIFLRNFRAPPLIRIHFHQLLFGNHRAAHSGRSHWDSPDTVCS